MVDLTNLNEEIEKIAGKNEMMNEIPREDLVSPPYALNRKKLPKDRDEQGTVEEAVQNYYKRYGVCDSELKKRDVLDYFNEVFEPYGENIHLYFDMQRVMIMLFAGATFFYGLSSWYNYRGEYLTTDSMTTYLDMVSIANFKGYTNYTTDSNFKYWISSDLFWRYLYYYTDFGVSIILLFFMLGYKIYVKVRAKLQAKTRPHGSKFTVKVSGFPTQHVEMGGIDETDLHRHFA